MSHEDQRSSDCRASPIDCSQQSEGIRDSGKGQCDHMHGANKTLLMEDLKTRDFDAYLGQVASRNILTAHSQRCKTTCAVAETEPVRIATVLESFCALLTCQMRAIRVACSDRCRWLDVRHGACFSSRVQREWPIASVLEA